MHKPFTYSKLREQDLKSSNDSSSYSRYFTKSFNLHKIWSSSKVSPHEFISSPGLSNQYDCPSDEEPSENFVEVREDELYLPIKNVPQEPPKKSVYSGFIKSPHLLSEDTSKQSFDISKSKETISSMNDNSGLCKTQSFWTLTGKFKEINFNSS